MEVYVCVCVYVEYKVHVRGRKVPDRTLPLVLQKGYYRHDRIFLHQGYCGLNSLLHQRGNIWREGGQPHHGNCIPADPVMISGVCVGEWDTQNPLVMSCLW